MVAHLRDSMDDNSKEENIEEHDPVLTLSKFQVMRVDMPLSLGCARDQANQFSRGWIPYGKTEHLVNLSQPVFPTKINRNIHSQNNA